MKGEKMKRKLKKIILTILTAIVIIPLTKASAQEIEDLTFTMATPVDGQQLITECTPEEDTYTVEIINWYKGGTVENPGTAVGLTGTYESGNSYIFELAITPLNDNTISPNAHFGIIGLPVGQYVENNAQNKTIVRFEVTPDHVVSFNTDGGTVINDVIVSSRDSLSTANKVPANPQKEGYTFYDWYEDKDFTHKYNFHYIVNESITIYAKFVSNDKIINNVDITVAPPVPGTEVTVTVDTSQGALIELQNDEPKATTNEANPKYIISYTSWVKGTCLNSYDCDTKFEGTFVEGTEYYADISIEAKDGYSLSNDLKIKVNGEDPAEMFAIYDGSFTYFLAKVKSVKTEDKKESKIKIEAVENNTQTNEATEEVAKLIDSIVDGKEINGIDDELKTKIIEAVDAGKTVYIEVTVPEVKETEIKEDAEKVNKIIKNDEKVGAYFDIDVVVKIDDEVAGNVTELADKIKVSLAIPTTIPKVATGYTRKYKVVRVHDGVAEELDATVSGDTVSFETDRFSTYALVYADTPTTSNPQTGDNLILYISFLGLSIIGLGVLTKNLKKSHNK